MWHIIGHAVLFAQQGRYERGLAMFRWSVTLAGVAILIPAIAIFVSKPKEDPEKEMSLTVKIVAATAFAVLGMAVIGFAWFGI